MKPVKQCKEFRTNSPLAEIRSEANPHPHPRMAYDIYLEIPCVHNDTLYYVDYRLQEGISTILGISVLTWLIVLQSQRLE